MLIHVLNECIRDKWDTIRGLFNYNQKAFGLSLPKDLGDTPHRILYKSADADIKAQKPIPKRKKKTTHTEQLLSTYDPKNYINSQPKTAKRKRNVVKYTK